MLPALLDGKNADAMVWADSASIIEELKRVDSFLMRRQATPMSRIQGKGEFATIPDWDTVARAKLKEIGNAPGPAAKVEHV